MTNKSEKRKLAQGFVAARAPGLTARAVLEKFASMQMVDVHLPTTDGKELRLPRYTEPSKEHILLLIKLGLKLPPQPRPELLDSRPKIPGAALIVVKTFDTAS